MDAYKNRCGVLKVFVLWIMQVWTISRTLLFAFSTLEWVSSCTGRAMSLSESIVKQRTETEKTQKLYWIVLVNPFRNRDVQWTCLKVILTCQLFQNSGMHKKCSPRQLRKRWSSKMERLFGAATGISFLCFLYCCGWGMGPLGIRSS